MKANLLVLLVLLIGQFACETSDLILIKNNFSSYEIILPDKADQYEKKSADELQKYLRLKTGVVLPILIESQSSSEFRILIGNTEEGNSLKVKQNEIIIKAQGNNLKIFGGDSKSTLYAVYAFLENHLGCRFYAPDGEVILKTNTVSIPKNINYRYLPPITTRTVHSKLFYENNDFADKRKTTYDAFPGYVPSAQVHTFHRFVPSDRYYKKHPEYYALRNGKRIPTQLCLTNADVFSIVKDTVAFLLQQYPESNVISVSQDDNLQYCQCDNCMAINNREETPAGSVIEFVNKIADAFPNKTISTLAYQYTRTAPKNLRPKENVLITLCSIECDRSAPIADKCTAFTNDLIAWGKLTDNIRIWDYTTQFTNFLAPFPNIHTLQPNIQLFRDNNAQWIFEQHSNNPSELFELRSYLTAKLLWNPDIDQDSITTDFLHGYYEEAAPFIQNYITTIHDEIQKDNEFFLFLYGDPAQGFDSFLKPALLKKYDAWYDDAENAVMDKPDILQRVRKARLSTNYAILEASRKNDPEAFPMTVAQPDGEKTISDELQERLADFKQTCKDADITLMNEMGFTVEEYLSFYQHTLSRAMENNFALGKKVQLLTKPKKYAKENPQVLTDGAFGGANFYANWLGFEGNSLEAIIDLENVNTIKQVSSDFLQVVNHIVFFPTKVKYYSSIDGKSYKYMGKVKNERPLSKDSKINDIQSYRLSFSSLKARYIKVIANSMSTAPIWHHGAGGPSWIFVDEISVN